MGVSESDIDAGEPPGGNPQKEMTIGAVCKALVSEFPGISISKIRYLEDQKLLEPRRTQGGYRLYSTGDVARLRTILRMQRDEFLPLRIIRQELSSGRVETDRSASDAPPVSIAPSDGRRRRPRLGMRGAGAVYPLEDVLAETRAELRTVSELEEYGVIRGETREGVKYFDETEREIIRAVTELAQWGVKGRNLSAFRSSVGREAALLQQILEPALRSRNPQRRKEALDALENLAAVTTHLKHLLLILEMRKIAG
jgi:DNA-binding transcriptional MerR regulator